MENRRTILITGTSSGIGRSTAIKFQKEGWNVVATMRSPEKESELDKLENVMVTKLDVQDTKSVEAAVKLGIERFGSIDTLVNNAGFAVFGAFEMATQEQLERIFEVNIYGPMRVTKALLPHMRSLKKGTIINITSQGGRITFPTCSLYHASKFAMEGFTESLAYELIPFGIRTKIIEPGSTETRFVGSAELTETEDEIYDRFIKTGLGNWARYDTMASTPEQIAETIYKAATDKNDTLRYRSGEDTEFYFEKRQALEDQEYVDFMRKRFIPEYL
ncbi:SDR family oxidoreductase [Chryseobacterium gregarium]|uniref:SDR family oxidoreductase n=1 Tax=Chryseobacterium gregarium TaxID=456299 RepID=UPI0003F9EA86|nr:SDR family oxidoreductase [Chryseobacterium gregarium]